MPLNVYWWKIISFQNCLCINWEAAKWVAYQQQKEIDFKISGQKATFINPCYRSWWSKWTIRKAISCEEIGSPTGGTIHIWPLLHKNSVCVCAHTCTHAQREMCAYTCVVVRAPARVRTQREMGGYTCVVMFMWLYDYVISICGLRVQCSHRNTGRNICQLVCRP